MQLPIPNDWNGEDWYCVQVQWPDSPQYIGILSGLLTMLQRGRLWDAETGQILDVQTIGREIAARNIPFNPCGATEPPEPPEIPTGGMVGGCFEDFALCGAYSDCEGCLMPCSPCPPVKIEDGILYWYNCGEWQSVGAVQSVPQEVPGIPTETPPGAYSQCGKIDAMATAIMTIAQAVWDNKNGVTYFLNIGAVDNALPGFDVNNQGILSLLSGARSLDDTYTESELLDPDYAQTWRCIGAPQLSTTEPYLTQAEYDTLYALWSTVLPADLVGWYQGIMASIGKVSLSIIAQSGAENTAADCACPAGAPQGFIVQDYSWNFTVYSPNTTDQYDTGLQGPSPVQENWKAAIFDWTGLNDPNGEIKVYDQGFQVISNYSTGAGKFALYNNNDAIGKAYLDLYAPGVTQIIAADPSEYLDLIMTIQTSGNNVQVTTNGTLTLVWQET